MTLLTLVIKNNMTGIGNDYFQYFFHVVYAILHSTIAIRNLSSKFPTK